MGFESKSILLIEERQSVITEIERAIFTRRYNLSEKHFIIFAKNSISILYSIWEGFINKIFEYFIDEINAEKVDFFSLNGNIIIYSAENEFFQLKEYPIKTNRKIPYYQKLKLFFNNRNNHIPININTESNVNFKVLNKLLSQFNLDQYPPHWREYCYPQPNLKESLTQFLRIRNAISHGGELLPNETITQKEFVRYKYLCLDLMYDIREKMITGLREKRYLK